MKKITFLVMALFLLFGANAQQAKKEIKVAPPPIELLGTEKTNESNTNNLNCSSRLQC